MLQGMPHQSYSEWGRSFWRVQGRTHPKERGDTLVLLRVAARSRRGSRVGSYVGRQTQTPAIRVSFVGSSGSAAKHNRDSYGRRQAPPRAKLQHGLGFHGGHRAVRRLDSTTKREIECRRAGQRRVELTLRDNFSFHISTEKAFCFSG